MNKKLKKGVGSSRKKQVEPSIPMEQFESTYPCEQFESFFPLEKVCGTWVNNFGAPSITIFRGRRLYRLVYGYGDGTKFICYIKRDQLHSYTYFNLYGRIAIGYDPHNDLLLTAEGAYTRGEYENDISTRNRIKYKQSKTTKHEKTINANDAGVDWIRVSSKGTMGGHRPLELGSEHTDSLQDRHHGK